MPPRSNLFQEVVSIIYEHLADGASIEESAMLPNRLTGYKREVDTILRSETAGHETIIAIEATAPSRAADVVWVEQMIGKHKNLPTDKVVLVAEHGFSKQAHALALAENMVPITPDILNDADPAFRIVNLLPSLWPKQINLTPAGARIGVDLPGEGVQWFDVAPHIGIYFEDGSSIDLRMFIRRLIEGSWDQIREQMGVRDIAEDVLDASAVVRYGPGLTFPFNGQSHSFYVQRNDIEPPELLRIDCIEITAKAEIRVSEIPLHHRRLAETNVNYAFGEGFIGDTPALVVVTEGEEGSKKSIRLNPRYKQTKS